MHVIHGLRSQHECGSLSHSIYQNVPFDCSIEVGREDENPVEIDVTWGDPTGKVTPKYRHYNRDAIENWTQAGDAVHWKVDVVRAGRYEMTFSYGCDPADAGATLEIVAGQSRLAVKIESTGGRMIWLDRTVGTLDLALGPALLEVAAKQIPGREAVVLHRIWLRYVGE